MGILPFRRDFVKWVRRKTPSRSQSSGKIPQEERRRRWRQSQEEEVVHGKTRDKLNNLVLSDKPTYDKLPKEVPTYKLITPSIVSERLKVRGSLARKALHELAQKGLIKQVVQHSAQLIYTRVTKDEETE